MLDDKLEELHNYIEQINAADNRELLFETMNTLIFDESEYNTAAEKFKEELSLLIQNAERNHIDEDILIQEIYHHLIHEIKKKLVFSYASRIGVERRMYKTEMGKLFKGKFK